MYNYLQRLLGAGRLVLALWIVLMLAAGAVYLDRFSIDNSVAVWFLADDPELAAFRDYNRAFGAKEWTFAVVETASIYDPGFLAELRAAGERIAALGHVQRVVSIANAKDSELDRDDALRYRPILDLAAQGAMAAPAPLPARVLEEFRGRLHDNPIFPHNLFQPGDDQHAALLIQNANLLGKQDPYRIELVDAVRAILEAVPSIHGYALAGTTVINAELNRAAKRDMLRYYVLIGLFLVVCGGLFLRRLRDLVVLLAVVVGSVLPTLGLAALLGWRFNMLTIMLPTVLVAMGVSAVVHLINDFHYERGKGGNGARGTDTEALARTLQALWRPALWTTLTTLVGFLSLSASTVVPVRQLGLLAATGIGLAWLHSMVLGPLLLHWLWAERPSGAAGGVRLATGVTHTALGLARRRPVWVLVLGCALLTALSGLVRLEANTDYVRFFRPDSTLRADYERIAATGFAQYYVSVEILYPMDSVYTAQPGFGAVQGLVHALEALPIVRKVLDAGQLLREADRAFAGVRARPAEFAGFGADKLAQLLLLTEASGNDDLADLISGDRSRTQLLVMTDYLSTKQLDAFRGRIESLARRRLPPDLGLRVTGTNVLWANMDAEVVRTQTLSLAITVVIIALLLPLILRSPLLGLLGLAVSLMPIAVTLGVMGWVGIRVNIATCLIGAVALGVAVDDSIYLLSRLQWERRRGTGPAAALHRAVRVSGGAMTTTSLILVGGFLTMAGSDFLPSAHFGLLFAMTVVLALFGDLVLLPTLLLRLWRRPSRVAQATRPLTRLSPPAVVDEG